MRKWLITIEAGDLWPYSSGWGEDGFDIFSDQEHETLNLPLEGRSLEFTPLEQARKKGHANCPPDFRDVVMKLEREGKISCRLGPQGELRWLITEHRAVLQ